MKSVVREAAREFMMPEQEMRTLIWSAPKRYKVFSIRRRRGAREREIAQPAVEIKQLQRWAYKNYLEQLPVHEAVTAYEKATSIKKNASPHAGRARVLKMDFRDFFPSITQRVFRRQLGESLACFSSEYSDGMDALLSLLFWEPKDRRERQLAVGAPSSPGISNRVMFSFDTKIAKEALERDVAYTRYADDLTFSTEDVTALSAIADVVKRATADVFCGALRLNDDKTLFLSKKHRRQITGLVLANDGSVSLGRERKRQIRAGIHRFSRGEMCDGEVKHLGGILAFANDVEPSFVERMRNRYGESVLSALRKGVTVSVGTTKEEDA
jgi:hypothetical protein